MKSVITVFDIAVTWHFLWLAGSLEGNAA